MMREINPRPGACVCVARWNGDIVYNRPQAYNAMKQGDSAAWLGLKRREAKHDNRPARRKEAQG